MRDGASERPGSGAGGAPPARYAIPGNDTVYDNYTGLTWQRTLDGQSHTYAEAQAACAALGSGWRVPAVSELRSLVDLT